MQTITTTIGRIWSRGCLGKAAIIVSGLFILGLCGVLAGGGGARRPAPAATTRPADASTLPAATDAPAASPAATTRPTVAATRAPLPTSVGVAPQGESCPADAPIKGNVRDREPDKGARIYHVPDSPSYAATKPERCFATVRDAQAAGFRPPR